ncbi:uncharacterized protein LOC123531629 isoform X1 [Mercenaria mercenaria]|uniref:uncharacterized protein LOC123531629 isoform X1 n=1 Tax=Mercenaria mercenaria TaxID=6596 RepID=UPI00234F53D2|nr:uncharacterized protein LOC123531629 isoform X1 [Mercenaria mercenaria]
MESYLLILGLISSLVIGSLGKTGVTVSRDITVKPTPDTLKDPADRVDVTLDCTGSRSDLSYYIKNRIAWSFTDQNGITTRLTESFYSTPELQALFEHQSPKQKYALTYGINNEQDGYIFSLTILRVTRADDGVYRCSLIGEEDNDMKEVRLTVVNPVESVSLEIHDAQHNVIATSKKAVTQSATPVKLTPGQYMVKCDASGSNPEPVMNLVLNDQKPYVSTTTMKAKNTEFTSYSGSFTVDSLTINAHNALQSLTCMANIPGDYYPSAEAGLALIVSIDKPTITCKNATAALGDKNRVIECKVTAGENSDALRCENLMWELSVKGQRIMNDQRWKDPTKEYDIIESKCMKTSEGIDFNLELFTITEKLFKETYFVVYGKGENIHKHPVTLYDVTVAAAGIASPLSLLACLVMAFVSKHLARL